MHKVNFAFVKGFTKNLTTTTNITAVSFKLRDNYSLRSANIISNLLPSCSSLFRHLVRCTVRKLLGSLVPGNERSLCGRFVPGNETSIIHFVCITWRRFTMLFKRQLISTYSLVSENVHMITNLPIRVFKWRESNKHLWEFYPQDGGENQQA